MGVAASFLACMLPALVFGQGYPAPAERPAPGRSRGYDVSVERPGPLPAISPLGQENVAGVEWDYGLVAQSPEGPYVRVAASYSVPLLAPVSWRLWTRASDEGGRSLKTEPARRTVDCDNATCTLTEVVHVRVPEHEVASFRAGGRRLTLIAKTGETQLLNLGRAPVRSPPVARSEPVQRLEETGFDVRGMIVCRQRHLILPRTPAECAAEGGTVDVPGTAEPVAGPAPRREPTFYEALPPPSMDLADPRGFVVCRRGGLVLPRSARQCSAEGGVIEPSGASVLPPLPSGAPAYGDPDATVVCQEGGLILSRTAAQCLSRGGRIEPY